MCDYGLGQIARVCLVLAIVPLNAVFPASGTAEDAEGSFSELESPYTSSASDYEVAQQPPQAPQDPGSAELGNRQELGEVQEVESLRCTPEQKKKLKAAVATSHKGVFFENDFNYLCDPCYEDYWLGDGWKRLCLGNCSVIDIGGQYRARHHSERNMRGTGLTGVDDDFLLHRVRLFANTEIGENVRIFAEYLDAESNYENFAPRGIEVNRSDLLNLFGDVQLWDGDSKLLARVGRQELLYGDQRVISPLDWANTRRTFEGGKLLWKGESWDVDAFYTRPVQISPSKFDNPNDNQEFMGIYGSYKQLKNEKLDLYYIAFNDSTANFKFDTFGTRYTGSMDAFLWDLEGAYQSGDFVGNDHRAGFWVAGVGRKFEEHSWKPTAWVYYDWASGDNTVGNGYHHLFPLAHRYNGFMDLFGRRNLEDVNILVTAQPHEKLKLLAWWHYLFLENKNDVPYSVLMVPFNPANRPQSPELGHEVDFIATWSSSPRSEFLLGYSHFFSGDYYRLTPGVPFRGDASFVYTQYTLNF